MGHKEKSNALVQKKQVQYLSRKFFICRKIQSVLASRSVADLLQKRL